MTDEKNSVIMAPANPVQTVAPEKEETEMLRATDKSSGKRRQSIHICYDLIGFIPLSELMTQEMA
jgi:hypothetical protein